MVPLFFRLHPFLCSEFSPRGDGPHDNLLSHGYRKVLNEAARKVSALVAAFKALFSIARPHRTILTKFHTNVGHAATAYHLVRGAIVKAGQSFFEFLIILAMSYVDSADSTIQAARRQ